MKKCTSCFELKIFDDYYKSGKYYNSKCKSCTKFSRKKYYNTNYLAKIKPTKKKYCLLNKKVISSKAKIYREHNLENSSKYRKEYYCKNRSKLLAQKKEYNKANKEKVSLCHKAKIKKNPDKYKQLLSNRKRIRILNDSSYRLRLNFSSLFRQLVKSKGLSKRNSIVKYMDYTIKELKEHLESRFESWMNWNNWGKYNCNEWNDNDLSTWRWQIDHIVPHSSFKYNSFEDEGFKECWSLNNLRPYNAKLNIIEGNRR